MQNSTLLKQDKVTVYVADDHLILRDLLRLLLERVGQFELVGEAGDGREAMSEIERLNPQVVILDISMPSMDGMEIARKIRRFHPETKIIMLTQHDDQKYATMLLRTGVHGYLLKDDAGQDLVRAIDEALKGNIYLSPVIARKMVSVLTTDKPAANHESPGLSRLTNREKELLKLIAEGCSNKHIAGLLFISPTTVKTHRANIMRKLELHSRTELVKYALKAGLIQL